MWQAIDNLIIAQSEINRFTHHLFIDSSDILHCNVPMVVNQFKHQMWRGISLVTSLSEQQIELNRPCTYFARWQQRIVSELIARLSWQFILVFLPVWCASSRFFEQHQDHIAKLSLLIYKYIPKPVKDKTPTNCSTAKSLQNLQSDLHQMYGSQMRNWY